MTDNNDANPNANSSEVNPQKELLVEAAAAIRKDQIDRERRRPKNVGEGALHMVRDSLGGIAMGTAAVVLGPVQGYKEGGPKGVIGGLLGGIAVGAASTTYGVYSGVSSFVHGASKTASKITPSHEDPRFVLPDRTVDTEIKDIYLAQRSSLYGELLAQYSSESAAASMDGLAPPVENKLYDVLDVAVDATPAQIRKAYYRMAQKYHPDKHPNDDEATARFQEISHAYQVLSDPVKREEYHRLGASAADSDAMVDPKALFALMFADFEHIVGDLATATILNSMPPEEQEQGQQEGQEAQEQSSVGATPSAAAMEARKRKQQQFQQIREEHLKKMLNKRLEQWVSGDEQGFIEHAKNEVLYLRGEPFGRDCLRTAAYIYKKKASRIVDRKGPLAGVVNVVEDLGEKAHSLKSQMRALEGGVKAISASQSAAAENETIDETAHREAVSTLGAVWLASVVDIESTLRHVVSAVLEMDNKLAMKSESVAKKAAGLLVLAKIFGQA